MALLGAVEAGGTKFVLALARADGTLVERTRIDTAHPDETLPQMAAFFREAQARLGAIGAFGIASFGPIDIDPASPGYGTFTTTPKPGWSGARFQDALAEFAVPMRVDTDVNGAALGEYLAGAGQGCSTLAYTTVGTGIGTGVVKHGQPVTGFSHYESGHIRPRRDAALDPFEGCCPYHGDCLEGLACGPAIIDRWGHDLSEASPEQVALIAGYIADLAASLVLLHMPDRLVFGGGVMKAPGLMDSLRAQTRAKLGGYIPAYDEDLSTRIVEPGLGDDAGITGAIELARQALSEG
ncbi:MAG: ROK family protein [Sphingomonadaceae bacterium]|nr:ROK family protein [Sphingomonadaceae bacterium]